MADSNDCLNQELQEIDKVLRKEANKKKELSELKHEIEEIHENHAAMDHQQRLNVVENTWKIQIEMEKERLKTIEEHRDSELELLAEQFENGHMEMFTIHQLLSYYNQESVSNAVRHSSRKLLRNFNKFERLVDDCLEEVTLPLSQTNLRLKPPIKIIEASPALQKFSEAVQSFQDNCPGKLPFEYLVLQRKVSRKCHMIQTTMNQIFTEHEVYQKKFGSSWKRFIGSKEARIDILRVLKTHYGQLNITMTELKELMEQFDSEALSENFNMLSLDYKDSNSVSDDESSISEHL
ncbi:hypothetical protein CAEBREN_04506 [Caenorhabditis brenneri]|uniref:Uncharacterized protein n=1 Tax=Caenorhabditis brenneri TaxID=135651 RepID=G0NWD4_CAEBE|nr:hypothetical protein CAEBREN_04506 [Caenorhabditis brenneri]